MPLIRRLVELSMSERRLLAAASVRLVMVALALRWLGFRRVVGRIPFARPRTIGAVDMVRARYYASSIAATQPYLPVEALCLAQSLTLHWWLCSEGIPSELRIGVAKQGHDLEAHAWVELNGAPVNGTLAELAPFTPLEDVAAGVAERVSTSTGRGL